MNEEYVKKLINKLSEAEHAYYVLNSPIMSDGEYDKLFKELKKIENENSELIFSYSPTQRVTGTPDTAFQAIAHKQRMYSIDNSIYEIELDQATLGVAPGQFGVIYNDTKLIGGGRISSKILELSLIHI